MVSKLSSSELSPIAIRNAQPSDINDLSVLLLHSFNHGLGESNNRWMQMLIQLSIQADLNHRINTPSRYQSTQHRCLVAVNPSDENTILGTVEVSIQRHYLWSSSRYVYLSNLAVQTNYRRQGIAYELLQRCELVGKSWGLGDMYLHVREDNRAARQLYERCGYQIQRIDFNLGSLLLRQAQPLFLHKKLQ
ncbi:MAG: GNAT family N-acetyltransferase [Cyanobacteria bacterium P01_F01_bin.150]